MWPPRKKEQRWIEVFWWYTTIPRIFNFFLLFLKHSFCAAAICYIFSCKADNINNTKGSHTFYFNSTDQPSLIVVVLINELRKKAPPTRKKKIKMWRREFFFSFVFLYWWCFAHSHYPHIHRTYSEHSSLHRDDDDDDLSLV